MNPAGIPGGAQGGQSGGQAPPGLSKLGFNFPTTAQEVLDCADVLYEDDQNDTSIPQIQKITKQNNILPTWGNAHSMNINSLVLENITSSAYFKSYLAEVKTYHEILDEIYYNVSHLEPWERGTRKTTGQTGMCGGVRGVGAGGVVSTAYCILYKLFVMRLTRKQLVGLINYYGSPYVRGLGFMYIRYCQPPADLWTWLEYYLDDEEEIDPRAGGGEAITIGQMVKLLLTKLDWFGTLFPRIPVPIQKIIEANFRQKASEQLAVEAKERAEKVEQEEEERKQRDADRSKEKEAVRSKSRERRDDRKDDRRDDRRDGRRDERRDRSRDRSRSKDRKRRRSPDRKRSRSPHSRRKESPSRKRRDDKDKTDSQSRRDRSHSPDKEKSRDSKISSSRKDEENKSGKRHRRGSHHHCKRKGEKHKHHHYKSHKKATTEKTSKDVPPEPENSK